MELRATDIHEQQFHDAWRGYNQEEVDDFLDRVAEVMDRTQRENAALSERVRELEQAVATSRETEEMLKTTLVSAQQAAEDAKAKARAQAEMMIKEAEARARKANEEARERRASAEAEIKRRAQEAERDHLARRRELDASIDRLRAFESELKQRLRTFLAQQTRALDTLTEREPPSPRAAPEGARRPQPREVRISDRTDTPTQRSAADDVEQGPREEVVLPKEAGPSPPRRIMRSLFLGREED